MTHNIKVGTVIATSIIVVIVSLILYLLIQRKRKYEMKALNIIIWLFTSLLILSATSILRAFTHDYIPIFVDKDSLHPIIVNIIRILNYIFILTIYIFGEQVISVKINRIRLMTLSVFTTSIIIVGIIDLKFNMLILTSDVLPFASDTRLDELLFDIIQVFVILFIFYVFHLQYKFASSKSLKTYALYIQLAAFLYALSMIYELFEHLLNIPDLDAFITGLPTIFVLGYVYIIHPRYIHLVPADIKFLQIIVKGGIPVYAADFDKEKSNLEFLVGPGLFSINTMIGELVDQNSSDFIIHSINHSNGTILFEQVGNLIGVIQTSRDSHLLRSSMQYLLQNFDEIYREDLINYTGILHDREITPDELLIKCMPIIESKQIVSNISLK